MLYVEITLAKKIASFLNYPGMGPINDKLTKGWNLGLGIKLSQWKNRSRTRDLLKYSIAQTTKLTYKI